jgi:hypothetical protein
MLKIGIKCLQVVYNECVLGQYMSFLCNWFKCINGESNTFVKRISMYNQIVLGPLNKIYAFLQCISDMLNRCHTSYFLSLSTLQHITCTFKPRKYKNNK